ncbi:hypothetical protein SDC9_126579 [bioreactor metagenome]|uniref:Uncharacterized protein n=1 Tax=bioreactor metagenome TaxID=1076179 RepID=A0A645CRJ4_9ZZZZ
MRVHGGLIGLAVQREEHIHKVAGADMVARSHRFLHRNRDGALAAFQLQRKTAEQMLLEHRCIGRQRHQCGVAHHGVGLGKAVGHGRRQLGNLHVFGRDADTSRHWPRSHHHRMQRHCLALSGRGLGECCALSIAAVAAAEQPGANGQRHCQHQQQPGKNLGDVHGLGLLMTRTGTTCARSACMEMGKTRVAGDLMAIAPTASQIACRRSPANNSPMATSAI